MSLTWSDVAEADLDDLYDYIARDVPYYAEQFVYSIPTALDHLQADLASVTVPNQNASKLHDFIRAKIDPTFNVFGPDKAKTVPELIYHYFANACPDTPSVVVNMKLSDSAMAKATGSLPQNVNFAISGQTLKAFLDANRVPYKTGGSFFAMEKSLADLGDEARKWTTVVECWK